MATTEERQSERQLRIEGFEGHTVDVVRVTFGGSVELNRNDPDAVALFKQLKLGKRVDLTISGRVKGRGFTIEAAPEDAENVVTGAKLTVDTIELGEA